MERGFFVCNVDGGSAAPEPENFRYEPGHIIVHDGAHVGTIVRRLGQGNYGTVYLLRRPDGTECAAKAIREDISEKNRVETEKMLAVEVSVGFALGKSALIASVISMVVPLPGVESTAKGMLLLCDLVEEAMHTNPVKEDYKGFLYTDEGMARWPLASLTLQLFTAFDHVHGRGVIHQVGRPFTLRDSYVIGD